MLDLSRISSLTGCHALHVLCSCLAVILLCLLFSLLALLLSFVLLVHVLDVCTGIPICRHLRYGKVPLATCQHHHLLKHWRRAACAVGTCDAHQAAEACRYEELLSRAHPL